MDAEDGEEVAAHPGAQDALGQSVAHQVEPCSQVVENGEVVEDRGVVAPEEEPRDGELRRDPLGRGAPHLHQAVRLRKGQRPEDPTGPDLRALTALCISISISMKYGSHLEPVSWLGRPHRRCHMGTIRRRA
jgi:hypothetical protein